MQKGEAGWSWSGQVTRSAAGVQRGGGDGATPRLKWDSSGIVPDCIINKAIPAFPSGRSNAILGGMRHAIRERNHVP